MKGKIILDPIAQSFVDSLKGHLLFVSYFPKRSIRLSF